MRAIQLGRVLIWSGKPRFFLEVRRATNIISIIYFLENNGCCTRRKKAGRRKTGRRKTGRKTGLGKAAGDQPTQEDAKSIVL